MPALVAGMVAGADSIDDMDLLRHGGMDRLFAGIRAPSTLGTFLRSFTFGHVRQLYSVAAAVLTALATVTPLLPGAVHLAVVDPGVGTPRRAAAVQLDDGGALIGPDNGLLAPAADAIGAVAAVALTPPTEGAATFHGRDLFAPAAPLRAGLA